MSAGRPASIPSERIHCDKRGVGVTCASASGANSDVAIIE